MLLIAMILVATLRAQSVVYLTKEASFSMRISGVDPYTLITPSSSTVYSITITRTGAPLDACLAIYSGSALPANLLTCIGASVKCGVFESAICDNEHYTQTETASIRLSPDDTEIVMKYNGRDPMTVDVSYRASSRLPCPAGLVGKAKYSDGDVEVAIPDDCASGCFKIAVESQFKSINPSDVWTNDHNVIVSMRAINNNNFFVILSRNGQTYSCPVDIAPSAPQLVTTSSDTYIPMVIAGSSDDNWPVVRVGFPVSLFLRPSDAEGAVADLIVMSVLLGPIERKAITLGQIASFLLIYEDVYLRVVVRSSYGIILADFHKSIPMQKGIVMNSKRRTFAPLERECPRLLLTMDRDQLPVVKSEHYTTVVGVLGVMGGDDNDNFVLTVSSNKGGVREMDVGAGAFTLRVKFGYDYVLTASVEGRNECATAILNVPSNMPVIATIKEWVYITSAEHLQISLIHNIDESRALLFFSYCNIQFKKSGEWWTAHYGESHECLESPIHLAMLPSNVVVAKFASLPMLPNHVLSYAPQTFFFEPAAELFPMPPPPSPKRSAVEPVLLPFKPSYETFPREGRIITRVLPGSDNWLVSITKPVVLVTSSLLHSSPTVDTMIYNNLAPGYYLFSVKTAGAVSIITILMKDNNKTMPYPLNVAGTSINTDKRAVFTPRCETIPTLFPVKIAMKEPVDFRVKVAVRRAESPNPDIKGFASDGVARLAYALAGNYSVQVIGGERPLPVGEFEITAPLFYQHEFIFDPFFHLLPTCEYSSDGIIAMEVPEALWGDADIVVRVVDARSMVTNERVTSITISRSADGRLVLFSNAPFMENFEVEIVVDGNCKWRKSARIPAPLEMYPPSTNFELIRSCSGVHQLAYENATPNVIVEWFAGNQSLGTSGAISYDDDNEEPLAVYGIINYGRDKLCKRRTRTMELERGDVFRPFTLAVDVLPIFCVGSNDAQAVVSISSADAHFTYVTMVAEMDGVPTGHISLAKRTVLFQGLAPGIHIATVRMKASTSSIVCSKDITFVVNQKIEYATYTHMEIGDGAVTIPSSGHTDMEITRFNANMFAPADRAFIASPTRLDGIPAGHIISIDVVYPQQYSGLGGRFCARPLNVTMPPPRRKVARRGPSYELVPAQQTLRGDDMPVPVSILANGREVARMEVAEMAIKTAREDAAGISYEVVFGGATLQHVVNYAKGTQRRRAAAPVTRITEGFLVVPTEQARLLDEPMPTQKQPSVVAMRVAGGAEAAITVFATEQFINYTGMMDAKTGATCKFAKSTNPYYPYKCELTLPVTSLKTMHELTATSKARRASPKTVVIINPALPLRVACMLSDEPSAPAATDGIINVMISGGVAPYYYFWSDQPSIALTNTNTIARTSVGVGAYTVYIVDSSAASNYQNAQTCVVNARAAPATAYIASASVGIPTRCGVATASIITLEIYPPSTDASTVRATAYSAGSAPVSCLDGRFGAPTTPNVTVVAGVGVWYLAMCVNMAGLTLSGFNVTVGPVNHPLSMTTVQNVQTCNGTVKVPAIVRVNNGLYLPFVTTNQANTDISIINDTYVVLGGMNVTGTTILIGEDARQCIGATFITITDTGPAPCGTCDVNDRSCYGCDGVPYSNATYDLCGVCNGNNACIPAPGDPCIINPLTPVESVPAIIDACVLQGSPVTGIGAPLITPPVVVPYYGGISITGIPFTNLTMEGATIFSSINNQMNATEMTNVLTASMVSVTPAGVFRFVNSAGGRGATTTLNWQTSTLANTTLWLVNRGAAASAMVVNFISQRAPAVLTNDGPATVVLITSGFAELVLWVRGYNQSWLVFQNDNYATSSVANLAVVVNASINTVNGTEAQTLGINTACYYLIFYPSIVTGATIGNLTLDRGSYQCVYGEFGGGGIIGTHSQSFVKQGFEGASWQFTFGFALFFIMVFAAAFVGVILTRQPQ